MTSLILAIAAGLSLVMAVAWIFVRTPGRSGWVDVVWSFAIGLAGIAAALVPVKGYLSGRRWLVAGLVALWSARLGLHILGRSLAHGEDPRYAEFRRRWGASWDAKFFAFLQIQAAAALLLSLSMLVAARNPAPFPAWSDWAGALLLMAAIFGEGIADRELSRFRRDPANNGRVCDIGLWSVSRHPNYFFEWLGWVAYAVIAIGPAGRFGWGWAALSGTAFMYWLLVHVSGIPPLEEHMLRSRGDAFRDYQRRVRAFFPFPKANP